MLLLILMKIEGKVTKMMVFDTTSLDHPCASSAKFCRLLLLISIQTDRVSKETCNVM